MLYHPHPYQDYGLQHFLDYPYCGLFIEMGLGKTVIALTGADELIYNRAQVRKILVIAPLRVAQEVWTAERDKWDHTKHLRISLILGTPVQRKAAIRQQADIYIINCENLVWLIAHMAGEWPWDMVIIDESSKFKSNKSQRFKKFKTIRPKIKRLVILTGTPVPNSLLDIWSQMYLVDMGERLGKTIGEYREKYFNGHMEGVRQVYELKTEKDKLIGRDYYAQKIYDEIGDVCISMKEKDWLDLPDLIEQDVLVKLPPDIMKRYLDFERDQVLAFAGKETVTAFSAGALTGKLLQFSNGAVYNSEHEYYEVHREKLDALAEDLEAANGAPFLLFYQFISDKERILKYLKAFNPHVYTKGDMAKWNRKEIPFMLTHAASTGHGLNIQEGGNLLGYFGVGWNLEHYQQSIKRIHRQGQKSVVLSRRYLTAGTMDMDTLDALNRKADGQEALMQAVKARIKKWVG